MNWLTKAFTSMRHAGRPPFLHRLLRRTRFDYRKEVGDCLDSSVVTAPVGWVQRALPEATLTVTRRDRAGNVTELTDHLLLALIQTPNAAYGDIALWMATVLSFLIAGNAYWLIVRNGAGRPVELWYVPHWMIDPRWPQDGSVFISHYLYSPGAGVEPAQIDPADVIHFRHGIDPRNTRLGMSPLDGVIREIFVDLESSNFVASLMRNMGVPGVVISPKGGTMPTPEDVQATKTWFSQAFGGDNRGGTLVMGGPTDVQSFGFSPQQLDVSAGRDIAEERVCACLGVPVAVVGFGAGLRQTKVGATMEEMRKLAWTNGVLPFARMLADELNRSLLPQFPGMKPGDKVAWDTRGVMALQEDQDKLVARWGAMLGSGAVKVREYRLGVGLEVDDSHDIYLRAINVVEVPVDAPPEAIAALGQAPGKAATGVKEAQATEAEIKRGLAYVNATQRVERGQRKTFEQALMRFFGQLGESAHTVAMAVLPTETPPAKGRAAKDDPPTDDAIVDAAMERLGLADWKTRFAQIYGAQYLDTAQAMDNAATGAGLGTSLPDTVARAVVAAGGKRSGLVDLDGQTREAVFKALADGRAEGEGSVALASRISQYVEAGPLDTAQARSRRIARTEVTYAKNLSTIERGRAAGVAKFMVFDGRLGPGRSLPSHIARNGSIVTADQAIVMAETEHPNGTLSLAPYFATED